jgi:hypothetical protein
MRYSHLSKLFEPLEKGKRRVPAAWSAEKGGMFMEILMVVMITIPVVGIAYKAFGY